MMRRSILLACLIVTGCSHQKPPTIATSIFCNEGADCAAKWAKATQWVKDNPAYDIASETNTSIATTGPAEGSPISALSATMKPVGHSLMRIALDTRCDKEFQCDPAPETLQADFMHAVDPQQNQGWAKAR